jgi:ribonuclease HI
MSFAPHIEELVKSLRSRLKPMRTLCGRSWGCDRETMHMLYSTLFASKMEYCASAFLPVAKPTHVKKLQVQQNAAARVVTRCIKATPVDALLLEAGMVPVEQRGRILAAASYEKSMRLPESNPRRACAAENVAARVQKQAWRKIGSETAAAAGLRADAAAPREPLECVAPFPPWEEPAGVHFVTELQTATRRNDPPVRRRAAAEAAIAALPDPSIEVWTDGAAAGGVSNGGCGALITFLGGANPDAELMRPAGAVTCSYQAEMSAIRHALEYLDDLRRRGRLAVIEVIHIYTDSKSAVERLKAGAARQKDHTSRTVWARIKLLSEAGAEMFFQWVPGHAGLPGNERADELARAGCAMEQMYAPVDYASCKAMVQRHVVREWRRTCKKTMPWATYVNPELERGLSRDERRVLAQMRAGGKMMELAAFRSWLTRASDVPESPQCRNPGCDGDEDVVHVLDECPAYEWARIQHFEGLAGSRLLNLKPKAVVSMLRAVRFTRRV